MHRSHFYPSLLWGIPADKIKLNNLIYGIGKTKPEYVLAIFNEDFSEVIIRKNGFASDGLMMDFRTPNQFSATEQDSAEQLWLNSGLASPMLLNADTLKSVVIEEGVVSLGERAFYDCVNIADISFPTSLKILSPQTFANCLSLMETDFPGQISSIPFACFLNCRNLKTVKLQNSATLIAGQAFYQCINLKNFEMPKSVKSIGKYAFYGCQIEFFDLPEGLERIEEEAFRDCRMLKNITIPSTTTYIGEAAFRNASSLTRIDVASGNKNYTSVDGVLYSIDKTLLLTYPAARAGNEYAVLSTVKRVAKMAFNKSSLEFVTFPDSLLEIGERVFESATELKQFNIPKNLNKIEEEPVYFCVDLMNVTIDPDNINFKISDNAIYSYDGKILYFYMFANNEKTTFETLPTTKEIKKSAFYVARNITEFTITDGVTEIPSYAFASSKATKINLPNSLTTIDTHAFFNNLNLIEITIPESVTAIDVNAFYQCENLTTIKGAPGSVAETFANNNGYTFVAI